jgi:uncharacterized OB-fold protein
MAEAKANAMPAPNQRPQTRPFWDAARQGKFMIAQVQELRRGAPLVSARICPFCFSDNVNGSRRRARARSIPTAVMRRAPVPYAMAYVTWKKARAWFTNIVDCDFDAVKIGQKVKVVLQADRRRPPLPMFTPA